MIVITSSSKTNQVAILILDSHQQQLSKELIDKHKKVQQTNTIYFQRIHAECNKPLLGRKWSNLHWFSYTVLVYNEHHTDRQAWLLLILLSERVPTIPISSLVPVMRNIGKLHEVTRDWYSDKLKPIWWKLIRLQMWDGMVALLDYSFIVSHA